MSMDILKNYLKENGEHYYSEVLAIKIVNKIEVFVTGRVTNRELIEMVTGVIKNHLPKSE